MSRRHALGFAVFCLLSGSRWLVENAFPSALPVLEQQCAHLGVMGLLASVTLLARRRSEMRAGTPWVRLATASLLLLGVPLLLTEAARMVSAKSGVALFALVPLVVVVGGVSFGAVSSQGRAGMMPALAGLAGALLLLPFQMPSTAYGGVLFGVVLIAVVSTAAGSLWLSTLLQRSRIGPAVVVLCAANGLVLGIAVLAHGAAPIPADAVLPELLRCVALDLPVVFLLVWLLRELPPAQMASRFLIVPLITALEGVLLMRPPVDLRMVAGMVVMAGGAAALLLGRAEDGEERPASLGLR